MTVRGRTETDGSVTFYDEATGTPALAVTGTGDSHLLKGTATAVNNSVAADVATLVTNYNALLVALRNRGIITGS